MLCTLVAGTASEFVCLCGTAKGEDLCVGQRKVADSMLFTRPFSKQTGGSEEHVKRFHELFFTLSPDKDAIESNIRRRCSSRDKSAFRYTRIGAKKGYYNRIISANINQTLQVDSVACDFDRYPYQVTMYARQMIIRASNDGEKPCHPVRTD